MSRLRYLAREHVLAAALVALWAAVLAPDALAETPGRIEAAIRSYLVRVGLLDANGQPTGGALSGLGSTDNALVRTDGTGGDQVQGSSVTVDDSGNVVAPASAGVVIGGATASGVKLLVGAPQSGLNVLLGNGSTIADYAGIRASRQLVMATTGTVKVDTIATFGLSVGSDLQIGFSSTTSASGEKDTGLNRASAGVVQVTDGGSGGGALQLAELPSDPAALANAGRLFTRDNGAGKTELCVRFGTGAVQVIATEP